MKSRGKTEKRICKYCGKEFDVLLIRTRQGKGLFCGKDCFNRFRNENKKNPKERAVLHQKKYKYGITETEYNNLFIIQDNKCAICRKILIGIKACVDHNHKTKKVRGILCDKCNRGIGFLNDDTEVLLNAIKYLKENE